MVFPAWALSFNTIIVPAPNLDLHFDFTTPQVAIKLMDQVIMPISIILDCIFLENIT